MLQLEQDRKRVRVCQKERASQSWKIPVTFSMPLESRLPLRLRVSSIGHNLKTFEKTHIVLLALQCGRGCHERGGERNRKSFGKRNTSLVERKLRKMKLRTPEEAREGRAETRLEHVMCKAELFVSAGAGGDLSAYQSSFLFSTGV